ncbi:hypothetical protein SDC9_88341 [bioreactor metagenome]|uniref:Uncharacterized protein n=1 Tax=bioreactor metagenome TaxID=1076179 RepID=A0A644ZLC4_9ZZZZ
MQLISNQREAGTGRHLDDCGSLLHYSVKTFHGEGIGSLDGECSFLASECLKEGIYAAFSSISYGNAGDHCVAVVFLDCSVHDCTDLFGTHGSFEGIGD